MMEDVMMKDIMRKYLLQIGLIAILVASFVVTENAFAVTNPCTVTNPCNYQVCGDHICSQTEFKKYVTTMFNAQRGNATTPVNMTGENMTVTTPSKILFLGTMSYEDVASDGTLVIISTNHPMEGRQSLFGIGFFKANGSPILDQNYAVTITQKNTPVFSDPRGYAGSGINVLTTSPMPSSDEPLSLVVTLKGVGSPTSDPSAWTGVKGETLRFGQGPLTEMNVIAANMTSSNMAAIGTGNATSPEFGPVAPIVFAIAILSVIAFATKARHSIKS